MIRYTTPTISLIVEGVDLTSKDVYVTLEQGKHELTKKGSDLTISTETVQQVTNTLISFTLSQAESAAFKLSASAAVQVNWISSAGVRTATEIKTINILKNLLEEVITYGD